MEDWTTSEYDQYANDADFKEDGVVTFVIRGHCVFNQLDSFHCILQMPPGIGYDFFEGCFAKDIQFYLNFLIDKEKLISQEEFNQKLKNDMLSSRDSGNRPKEFRPRKNKYEGNAGSLRVLGRILPMLLSNLLDESRVGHLIVKLQEVSELITAPKLTLYEIDKILNYTWTSELVE